jgi:hypothetical protein
VALALALLVPLPVHADTPRRAPAFAFLSADGPKSLPSLRGKPVVLLVTDSARSKALRKQLKNLKPVFHDLASRGTVFAAALTTGEMIVPSDIPFALVSNPAATAAAYGMRGGFLIAVIGPDGNLDLQTEVPLPGLRVREILKNNFEVQEKARREIPKGPPAR